MYFDRDAFERHVSRYTGKFEERRRYFLMRFYLHLLIALGALVLMLLLSQHIPNFRLTYIAATLIGLSFTLWPLFAYRRRTESIDGIVELKVSLKEFVFSNIFNFFGDLEFKRKEGISLQALERAPLLPEYNVLHMEDRTAGQFAGVDLEMSEVELLDNENGQKVRLFKGMFIILDISEIDTALREPFSGKTILLQDKVKHLEKFKEKYSEYKPVPLPTPEYEERFEAVSTAPDEAGKLLTIPFLDTLSHLAATLTKVKQQITHRDDIFIRKLYKICGWFGSIVISLLVGIPYMLANLLLRRGYVSPWMGDITDPVKYAEIKKSADTPLDDFMLALAQDIHCSFYDDKVFISVPYDHDLFEPNSLFEPALVEEDKDLIFNLMEALAEIANSVTHKKAS